MSWWTGMTGLRVPRPRQQGRADWSPPHSPEFPPLADLSEVAAELTAIAEHACAPRLIVRKLNGPRWIGHYRWAWRICTPGQPAVDGGLMPTWGEALAVGLAALEQATARTTA